MENEKFWNISFFLVTIDVFTESEILVTAIFVCVQNNYIVCLVNVRLIF